MHHISFLLRFYLIRLEIGSLLRQLLLVPKRDYNLMPPCGVVMLQAQGRSQDFSIGGDGEACERRGKLQTRRSPRWGPGAEPLAPPPENLCRQKDHFYQ